MPKINRGIGENVRSKIKSAADRINISGYYVRMYTPIQYEIY